MNRVGRPKKPKDKSLTPGISARFTPAERNTINAAIKKSGLRQSVWVRKSLLYVAPRPPVSNRASGALLNLSNAVASNDYIEGLRIAIQKLHGCDSVHSSSAFVKEVFQGNTVAEGRIEIFDLIGHPKTKRCYAWTYPEAGGKERFIAVLEIPPIDSPTKALQAAIASTLKSKKE